MSQETSRDLIKISVSLEDGTPLAGFRYHGVGTHLYRDGKKAGEFKDGKYTCWHPDGHKSIEIDYDAGVRVRSYDKRGTEVLACATKGLGNGFHDNGRKAWQVSSGKLLYWHPNGGIAVNVTLCQEIWTAWGVSVDVDGLMLSEEEAYAEFLATALPLFQAALSAGDPWIRAYVCASLESLGSDALPTVPGLEKLLSDPFWLVRLKAAEALGAVGPGAANASPSLITVLQDEKENPTTREAAGLALGRMASGDGAVVYTLDALLRSDETPRVMRRAAAEALGLIGSKAAQSIPALKEAAGAQDKLLRIRALSALWKIGAMTPGSQVSIPEIAESLGRMLEADATRKAAADALGEMREKGATARWALIQALRTANMRFASNGEDAYCLADALNRVDPSASELETWTLPDDPLEYSSVKMPALFAICMVLRDPEIAAPILAYRTSRDLDAQEYIKSIGPEARAAVPGLVYLLGDNIIPLREWACAALGKIGEEAIPELRKALTDESYLRRWTAPDALRNIGKKAVPALIEAVKGNEAMTRIVAARALGTLGRDADEAIPSLKTLLNDDYEPCRRAAAEALGRIEKLL